MCVKKKGGGGGGGVRRSVFLACCAHFLHSENEKRENPHVGTGTALYLMQCDSLPLNMVFC